MADVPSISRSVYIISDLHLGGVYGVTSSPNSRGFRICTHSSALTDFVNSLAAQDSKVELVINGDMVDFLAEQEFAPFTADPAEACAKLQAIVGRDQPFFDALTNFLNRNHRLAILLGSHDTELCMPPVRRKLREILGVQPDHDYELISNGEAYRIGEALIEHGNRYDDWNVVNYNALRRIGSLMSRDQPLTGDDQFDPPAGSKMVAWVINLIKQDYKFIDLLKPETDVAIPVVLALEPGYRQILATVAKLANQARQHQMEKDHAARPSIGDDISSTMDADSAVIGGDISSFGDTPGDPDEAALEEVLKNRLGGNQAAFEQSLNQSGAAPEPNIGGDISTANVVDRTWGLAKLLFARDDQDVGKRLPALLQSLRALQPDQSFSRDVETDPACLKAANDLIDSQLTKGGFKYVIFGHTHLAKRIELSQSGCYYLNSGTWADLMQLPSEIITGDPSAALAKLQHLAQSLATGMFDQWILFRPTYVRLDLDAGDHILNAELCDYQVQAATTT
jgi:UDP-2,3-diacylglucosamine pyrophosphatase LpxH